MTLQVKGQRTYPRGAWSGACEDSQAGANTFPQSTDTLYPPDFCNGITKTINAL